MYEMTSSSNRWSNEAGASLPGFIRGHMERLDLTPSYTQLSLISGVPVMTLQANLTGKSQTKLRTAKAIANALKVSLDELSEKTDLA